MQYDVVIFHFRFEQEKNSLLPFKALPIAIHSGTGLDHSAQEEEKKKKCFQESFPSFFCVITEHDLKYNNSSRSERASEEFKKFFVDTKSDIVCLRS